ncbi:outer membrane beta-barrel protein [Massilia sp. P8910]|uniref:OmpW family protein n=1 Tax=Massilia antarctica TaxID=2765360 RepID=A0AA48WEC0_9BURK|nr:MULTISPECIES: OmpW family outer membrane protein [Massilia]CUI09494.1 Outer membrane protein W precursor [Janthinobacterium sp. CG23_2]MCE3603853.1 outer membrane beta-barrel protein [Massilia antarctica]MCY0913364.1 outer membrane beta-barrel protein [Massilia sp. H27-R4]QPI50798.1 OmpW family protein [Massilia antarctica]CUU33280.1 Outer membrane protein W precursor [Janthinobacterium sp. CG23_2]
MKLRMSTVGKAVAAAAVMAVASGASAQSAGQWTAKGGIATITPKVKSGDVSAPALPGTKADIGSDTKPVFSFSYSLTDNVSAELDLGMPFKHTLYGAGSIEGTGKLGTVKALPPTMLVQYRFFKPDAMLRPYLGAGITYAYFAKETGSGQMTAISDIGGPPTTFKVKNKLAGTLQAGLVYNINDRWFADVAYIKTFLKTKVDFSSGQTQDITLDPQVVSFGIGYKF